MIAPAALQMLLLVLTGWLGNTGYARVMEEVAGDTALLVPAGDVAALADALDAVVGAQDDDRRQRGLARARRYTWAATAAGHAAVYRSVG